jgi:hypothetical protein
MKLSGLWAKASVCLSAESCEAENLLILALDSASTWAFIPVLSGAGFSAKADKI